MPLLRIQRKNNRAGNAAARMRKQAVDDDAASDAQLERGRFSVIMSRGLSAPPALHVRGRIGAAG
jgi:hypothetical protein